LVGRARLLARQGSEEECRALLAEALRLSHELSRARDEARALATLGELELGLGNTAKAVEQLERQQRLLAERGITDTDLSAAPELVDTYLRLGRVQEARRVADEFLASAERVGRRWSLARAWRVQGQLADDHHLGTCFERALLLHASTTDLFQIARTRLAYGERLRRARERILARSQLRAALDTFQRLGARPWAERARAELAATSETLRRRDPTTIDQLTAQELQIGLLLASGNTTREAAAALFLSPKTIEYHLRHVYQKLGIHSREELTEKLSASPAELPLAA
jgi:ATP/maltotriose-dependent transcriptional regulator MalT